MIDYELIEHTADLGIKVYGKDLKELFSNSASAMFDIIARKKPKTEDQKPKTKHIIVEQKAENLEELFAGWLNELLSLSAVNELIFNEFRMDKLDENNLKAEVSGFGIKNYKINTEIKAATYYELKLEKTSSGWQAKVIFDV